jgi:DNA polymerase-1
MDCERLLNLLRDRGFSLTIEGDGIRVSPASELTAEDRGAIKAHKPGLLALFAENHPAAPSPRADPPPNGCPPSDPAAEASALQPAGVVGLAVTSTLVRDTDGLELVKTALESSKLVAVDTETTGLNLQRDPVRLLSLATNNRPHAYLIDCFAVNPAPLWPVLRNKTLTLHNATFDLPRLALLGFEPAGPVHDTQILAKLLTAGLQGREGKCTLRACAERELGIDLPKELQKSDWSTPELTAEQLQYAARDPVVTRLLYKALRPKITAAGLEEVATIERGALPAIVWLTRSGLAVDKERLGELAATAEQEAVAACRELDQAAPPCPEKMLARNRKNKRMAADKVFVQARSSPCEGWNWNGAEQAQHALNDAGCKIESTAENILAEVKHPLARLLVCYRKATKQISTYGDKWLGAVAPDGRVYPNWKPYGVVTGRMSCSEPNAQQLPRGEYRKAIVAPPGKVLIKADFSQLQLRIAAAAAPDEAMQAAYQEGRDLHAMTAQQMIGQEEPTKEDRQKAKAVNFGTIYGQGAESLATKARESYQAEMSVDEAEEFRAAFFRTWPGIQEWHRRLRGEVLRDRFSAGRSRPAAEIRSPSGRRVLIEPDFWYGGRAAYHVQAREADGFKKTLALLWERRGEAPDSFPVVFCHDEIVIQAPIHQARAAADWLHGAMMDGMSPQTSPAPLVVEVSAGPSWGELYPVEEWLAKAKEHLPGSQPPPPPGNSCGQEGPGVRQDHDIAEHDADQHANARPQGKGSPPLKWFGGKSYLAKRIVELMPRHLHYVEPFAGGLAVLLARDPEDQRLWLPPHKGVSELVNDVNGRLMNFWRVLRDVDLFPRFLRQVQATPLARAEWETAYAHEYGADPLADAVAFFVDCRQSRAGMMNGFTPLTRTRTRRGVNGNASEWWSAVEGLADVHARLSRVVVENLPAVEVIRREDTPATLFYCDPPYLHDTRTSKDAYAFEMTDADHRELLQVLKDCKGKVMLSGYPSDLYDRELAGWNRHTFDLPNHAAGGEKKDRETECLWCNC